MLNACTSKWLGLHPSSHLSTIESEEPAQRTRDVLLALYRYYRDTEKMWASAYRDLEIVPAPAEPMAGFEKYLAAVSKELRGGWKPRKPKRLRVTLDHAAYSSPILPPISRQSCHPFHGNAATDSSESCHNLMG